MARARKGKKSKKKGLKVNFSGVEGRVLLPEGDYLAKVDEVEQKEGNDSGEPYLVWTFETKDDEDEELNGKKVWYNTSLQEAALWNLRNLLETLSVEIPEEEMELELEEYVGMELMLTIEHETYQGKKKARVVDFAPAEDGDDDEAEVEDDESNDDGEEGEGAETYSADEINDMSAKELTELIKEHELEIDKKLKGKKKKAAVIDALEEADLLSSDDED